MNDEVRGLEILTTDALHLQFYAYILFFSFRLSYGFMFVTRIYLSSHRRQNTFETGGGGQTNFPLATFQICMQHFHKAIVLTVAIATQDLKKL